MMSSIAYKKNIQSVVNRLTAFYERNAEDRIFVVYKLNSQTMKDFGVTNPAGQVEYPEPKQRARFWDSLLKEKTEVEDDSIPSAYLSEFDQGLYAAAIGGDIRFICDPKSGWISSMVKPMYHDLTRFSPPEIDINHPWMKRYIHQLEVFAKESGNRFGISHFILIDGLNFIFELVGATKTYLSLFECPEKVRDVISFALDLNIRIQDIFFRNTPSFQGGTFSNMVQWVPGKVVSESVDPFHMTSVDDYEQWGRENVERMFDHYDGGVLHIHSNGRHLLHALSKLEKLKAIYLLDEKGNPPAFDMLPLLKKETGDVPLIVEVTHDKFEYALEKHRLPGGVMYVVESDISCDQANRNMEKIRSYKN